MTTRSISHRFLKNWPSYFCASLLIATASQGQAAAPLEAGKPIMIAGTHGKFDFIAIDPDGRRLLAAHTGNASLDVIDLDKNEVTKIVPTGAAQDCAVDHAGKRYFVSTSKPPQLVVVDSGKLEVTGTVSLSGPADLMAFDAKTGSAYVGHDDGSELWIVDPGAKKVTGTVALASDAPEGVWFDAGYQRIFQAMKTGSIICIVDVATNKVTAQWPTAPAKSPHGMALVPEIDALLVAGGNGTLVLLSQKDGHLLSSTDIPERVDQIAYDAETHRAYCASGTGKIGVIGVEKDKLASLGTVPSSEGAHSIAIDPKTHTVWTAYAKGDASFVQPFIPAK